MPVFTQHGNHIVISMFSIRLQSLIFGAECPFRMFTMSAPSSGSLASHLRFIMCTRICSTCLYVYASCVGPPASLVQKYVATHALSIGVIFRQGRWRSGRVEDRAWVRVFVSSQSFMNSGGPFSCTHPARGCTTSRSAACNADRSTKQGARASPPAPRGKHMICTPIRFVRRVVCFFQMLDIGSRGVVKCEVRSACV